VAGFQGAARLYWRQDAARKLSCLEQNMKTRMMLIATAGLLGAIAMARTAAADQGPEVYVVTLTHQFGVVNLRTGAFRPIGNGTPETDDNLVRGPGGMLFSLALDSGNLVSINPDSGATTVIGPTGLPGPSGSLTSVFHLAEAGGRLYMTDFANNLYSVNASTGHATLIGPTGIPPDPEPAFTFNADGTLNLCAETFYGVGDKIIATFTEFRIDPVTLAIRVVIPPRLWQIHPSSGLATMVGDTLGFLASVQVDGEFYAFLPVITAFSPFGPVAFTQLYRLDPNTGKTTFVRNIDAAVAPIDGAAPAHGVSALFRKAPENASE
jgi:hypothetical protein